MFPAKNRKIRIISAFLHLLLVFSMLLPSRSHAFFISFIEGGGVETGDVFNDVIQRAENRYGFDQDTWRTAKRKVNAPRTEIFFDNTNPKPGEKVSAHAVPEFFKNDPQNLYYTWYLIHTEDGTSETATNSLEKGKEEAAGIVARGDYDPELDDQTYADASDDPDKDGWPAVDDNSYARCSHNGKEDDENDCSFAPMGGADGVGGLNEELREKFSTADAACRDQGDPSVNRCSFFDQATDEPTANYFNLQSGQTNFWCNACFDQFSAGGGLPATADLAERNQCCYDAIPLSELQCDDGLGGFEKCPFNSSTDYCGSTFRDIFQNCYDNFRDDNKATVSSCISSQFNTCKSDWTTSHTSNNEEVLIRVSRCYKHKFGVNSNPPGFGTDDSSGIDQPVACDHKWQHADNYTSGSGKFPNGEEEFWRTDPRDPNTDGDGFPDEADIIGLGQDTFTWTYKEGDRVGVVVEGTSMIPTDEKNSYYKIMWGNLDVCDSTKTDLMKKDECDDPDDFGFGYLATKSPSEESQEEKIKASLSFSPENPVADPTSAETLAEADQIDVISSLDNTTLNPGSLYYTWYVQKEDSGSSTGWGKQIAISENFTAGSRIAGVGASSLNLTPKKDFFAGESGDIVRIKVTLAVSRTPEANEFEQEKFGRKTPRRGYASVEIPINKNGVRMTLHKVEIQNGKAVAGEEICNDGVYKTLCPAVRGQMLAAKIVTGRYKSSNTSFFWKLNDTSFAPPANFGELFNGWNETTVFFPITGEVGEIQNISSTAVPNDKLQPVTGSRMVTVVEPAAFVTTDDPNLSWPLKYIAANSELPNASREIVSPGAFEAVAGEAVTYGLNFVPDYALSNDSNTAINWSVNGTSISDVDFYANNLNINDAGMSDNGKKFTLTMPAEIGSYLTLGTDVKKYWSEDEKKISYAAWGISPEALSSSGTATISTVEGLPLEANSLETPTQFLAAIGTHLPHYLAYNLRLALTILVMFFMSAGFYALSQSLSFGKEK